MNTLKTLKEDKKKGCGIDLGAYMEVPKEYENAPDKIRKEKSFRVEVICGKQEYCPTCKSNIAILEQAIAEMQKQRQAILDKIEKICNDNQMYADMDEDEFWRTSKISPQDAQKRADYNYELFEHLIKQLNQPKEEMEE